MPTGTRPKIGLALSGASGRSIAHVAILEVLQEHKIPIDIIVGCSSGAIVTVGFGAGTMPFVKDLFFNINRSKLVKMWSMKGAKGGLFTMRNAAAQATIDQLTLGKKFEDLPLKVGVTAADLKTGELVTITSGDMAEALRATACVPGLFEPVILDGRILVDGGLVNIVPTVPVKQLGADIVIGVDLALTKFIYQRKMWIWRIIRRFRRLTGIHYLQHEIIKPMTSKIISRIEQYNGRKPAKVKVPNMFRVLAWAVDHSFDIEQEWREENRACDLMITPQVTEYGKLGIDQMQSVYDEGRRAGLAAIPKIRQLIAEHEKSQTQPVTEIQKQTV